MAVPPTDDSRAGPAPSSEAIIVADRAMVYDDIVGGLLHGARNPLQSLTFVAQTIAEQIDPAATAELVAVAQREAAKLSAAFEYLSIVFDRDVEDVGPVALPDVVRTVLALQRTSRLRPDLIVAAELPPDLPPVVGTVRDLSHALCGVINNAKEAVRAEGSVTVVARGIADHAVELSIEDDGEGVPESNRDAIFDPGFTTKAGPSRIGCGLTAARALARRFAGDVTYRPRTPTGSCVTFRLKRWGLPG